MSVSSANLALVPRGVDEADVEKSAYSGVIDTAKSDNASNASKGSRSLRFKRFVHKFWLWEFSLWLLSALALAFVGGVLLAYDNQPLPHRPFGITLNSLISVIGAVTKAAMFIPLASIISQSKWAWYLKPRRLKDFETFDSAWRDPLSALHLLFITRGKNIAALGAVLVVATVPFDPFMQQVVNYASRPTSLSTATIPWAQNYSDFGALSNPPPGAVQVMEGAIYNGLFHSDLTPESLDVFPTCRTGNCTWPYFSSLAICSECRNITSYLREVKIPTDTDMTFHAWTLPNSLKLDGKYEYIVTNGHPNKLIDLNPAKATVGSVSLIKQAFKSATAFECILFYCVNTYSSIVEGGKLNETIVSSWHGEAWRTYHLRVFPSKDSSFSISDSKEYTDSYAGFSLSSSGYASYSSPDYADSAAFSDAYVLRPPSSMIIGEEKEFRVGSDTYLALKNYVSSVLTGKDTGAGRDPDPKNAVLASLYNNNEEVVFQRLARSITSNIRQHNRDNRLINGTAWGSETYVHVRWAWFILPMALDVLTLALLVTASINVTKGSTPLWKSSTLPILRCKVLGRSGNLLDACEDLVQLEILAKETVLHIEHSAGGSALFSEQQLQLSSRNSDVSLPRPHSI